MESKTPPFNTTQKKLAKRIFINEKFICTAANTGIGGNGGLTQILQLKNKARQWSGVDLILQQNPVTLIS